MLIIQMTPKEAQNGGENFSINYSFQRCQFGELILASTTKGLCHISFIENEDDGLAGLKKHFPKACYSQTTDLFQKDAFAGLDNTATTQSIRLHLKGTPFQLKVWEALTKIPQGSLTTYAKIATEIGKAKANRAVGSAIGRNPIALIIPCHRVIQSSGNRGEYMWGAARKSSIIDWEESLNL